MDGNEQQSFNRRFWRENVPIRLIATNGKQGSRVLYDFHHYLSKKKVSSTTNFN